jgi:hypothetical protein
MKSHKASSPNKRLRIADESDEDIQTSPLKDFADYKVPDLKNRGFAHNKAMAGTMYGTTQLIEETKKSYNDVEYVRLDFSK